MREIIVYLLIGFFLNKLYNLVKREWWVWRRIRRIRQKKRYSKPPQIDISLPKGMYKLPNNEGYEFEMQGMPLPEGAEDFDLKGFMVNGETGEVTGNWTQ